MLEHPDQERYRRVKERVEERYGLYGHAAAYGLVNAMLFAINILTSPEYLWFLWPLLGWGIGLASHAFGVLGKEWQERKIQAIMERERRERQGPDEPEGQTWPNL